LWEIWLIGDKSFIFGLYYLIYNALYKKQA